MSYRSKIKICGIKSAAEARAVLACSSAFCANLERADGAKNSSQSGGENSACRAQNHANFTCEQNCDCDKNFDGGSRNGSNASGVRVEFLGVIFVSSSKRRVSIDTAREIAHIAHKNGAKCVGVFALSSEKHSAAACENFGGKTRGDEIYKDKICAGKSGSVEFYEAAEFCEKQRNDLSINLNANCAAPASMEDLNSKIFGAEALGEEQILKICSLCELD